MTKRMLIDASHAEETRVVVLDGNRLEDFDVETASRRQLKGNIYLAKVVRVEPSLQAAFVEYGGNRHGFLAFGEIHPDYYQIPVADRQRLLAMQEEEARAEEEAEDEDAQAAFAPRSEVEAAEQPAAQDDAQREPAPGADMAPEAAEPAQDGLSPDAETPDAETADAAGPDAEAREQEDLGSRVRQVEGEAPAPEASGSETEDPRPARSASRFMRSYKIQEVIRRRQILLIQVVKEERGTKGAALTTYISLAGRYCVLMPNSPRGGGISRKITSASDRRRLKEVTAELDIPRGMGLIVRTAGAMRPKPEIKRDGEYLLRLWDDIREKTMASMAPALIHEEATLIKRVIRDVYARDVDELLIDGEDGWRAAREFMRMIMPTHVKKVQLWPQGGQPLFAHQQVESMLDAMLNPTVQLRSGGYLVINQTEALVAIDVNSGRSTRERGIEETALRTNLEAAEETARQLRLRDLAGLVVIDFIDMESKKHNAMVERRMAESLKNDRARIQIGHISHFGLMELSRQRLRPSLAETSLTLCENCGGTGHVRSTESAALHVLREIEEEGGRLRAAEILVHVAPATAIYILNNKRARLGEIEQRYRMVICFAPDEALQASQTRIDKVRVQAAQDVPVLAPAVIQPVEDEDEIAVAGGDAAGEEQKAVAVPRQGHDQGGDPDAKPGETAEEGEQRRRRRRRRRRGGRRDEPASDAPPLPLDAEQPDIAYPQTAFPVLADQPASETDAQTPVLPPVLAPVPRDETVMQAVPAEVAHPATLPEPLAEVEPPPTPVPGHDEASEAMVEAAVVSPRLPEADTETLPAKRSRRGGRRRRKPGEEAEMGAAAGAEAPAGAPAYVGPTPADPFALQGGDMFDLAETPPPPPAPRRAPSRRAKAAPVAVAPPPAEESAPELLAPELLAPGTPATGTPATETPAAEAPVIALESSVVRPVLIGAGEAAAEKKRGWWRK